MFSLPLLPTCDFGFLGLLVGQDTCTYQGESWAWDRRRHVTLRDEMRAILAKIRFLCDERKKLESCTTEPRNGVEFTSSLSWFKLQTTNQSYKILSFAIHPDAFSLCRNVQSQLCCMCIEF